MKKRSVPQSNSSTVSMTPKRRLWIGTLSFAFSFGLVFAGLGAANAHLGTIQSFLTTHWNTLYVEVLTNQAMANEKALDLQTSVPTPHMAFNQIGFVSHEILPQTPAETTFEKVASVAREDILKDPMNRISQDFKVPAGLEKRTQFWFDIYTKHDAYTHVVHHVRYPWIVYKIIDIRPMVESGKGPYWLRKDRAEKFAKAERNRIAKSLKRLAQRTSYKKLPADEAELYKILEQVKGKRRAVLKMAAANIRSQLGQKDFFVNGLKNSGRYLPYMEEEFAQLGVPTELTRIPFVESSFNEKAVSKVGASGIWQIMPLTGKAYLKIDNTVDERNSPLKATVVAAKLFKSYNKSLKSWPLTVTSYNHGIGNIQKAIKKAKSRDLTEIIDRYHQGDFKFASSNFFTCFLAALHAEKYHDVLFIEVEREKLLERKIYTLTSNVTINTLKKSLNLTTADILAYNQDLAIAAKKNITLRRGFTLHLPPGHEQKLLERIGVSDKKPDKRASSDTKRKRSA